MHLIKTEVKLNGDQQVRVFSKMFDVGSITKQKLTVQYGQRSRNSRNGQWKSLMADSPTARRKWQVMRERITRAANDLGIEIASGLRLGPRSSSSPAPGTENGQISRTHRRTLSHVLIETPTNDLDGMVGLGQDTTSAPSRLPMPKTPQKELATVLYGRPSGSIMLTPKAHEKALPPLAWPDVEPQCPALMFRWVSNRRAL